MQKKLVGIQKVNFQNNLGELVQGIKLHCLTKDDRVQGDAVETIWISSNSRFYQTASKFAPNISLDVTFTRRGQVDNITVL